MKKNLIRVVMVLMVALLAVGCTETKETKRVASIDSEAIYGSEKFKQAEKEFAEFSKAKHGEYQEQSKDKSDTEKRILLQEIQSEIIDKRKELVDPLSKRARGAVESIARKGGYLVVIDKKIVLYGVDDITDEAKKLFDGNEEISLAEEPAISEAPIGYFDQQVIGNLKVFQQAQQELMKKQQELQKARMEKIQSGKLDENQIRALDNELRLSFKVEQERVMAPLYKAVSDSVEKVAKEGELSLVLDKEHVMFGGVNMTSHVADAFIDQVDGPKSSGEEAASTEKEDKPSEPEAASK